MPDLRERQKATTRDQIIEAVHDLLSEGHPATISIPQVAARAGTSLRTVYRYFPTKEALVDAASETFRVSADVVGGTIDLETLPAYLRVQWRGFSEAIGAVKAQHLAPAGQAMRESRLPRSRETVAAALAAQGLEPDARLVDLLIAVVSSSTYLELVERLGHETEDAADLAAWAAGAIVDRARREGGIR